MQMNNINKEMLPVIPPGWMFERSDREAWRLSPGHSECGTYDS